MLDWSECTMLRLASIHSSRLLPLFLPEFVTGLSSTVDHELLEVILNVTHNLDRHFEWSGHRSTWLT